MFSRAVCWEVIGPRGKSRVGWRPDNLRAFGMCELRHLMVIWVGSTWSACVWKGEGRGA